MTAVSLLGLLTSHSKHPVQSRAHAERRCKYSESELEQSVSSPLGLLFVEGKCLTVEFS